jgi:hypothetical protein
MDDYSGTSYRVGSGPTASRGQPALQARDNQAFNRD